MAPKIRALSATVSPGTSITHLDTMPRFLLSYIIYIVTVNRTPFATFDNHNDLNTWVQHYKVTHPVHPELSSASVTVYKCLDHDIIGQKCYLYKAF